jgi:hypothetical protein
MNCRALGFIFIAFKGATAYEIWAGVERWGVADIRVVHLRGQYWRFKPWRRVSVKFRSVYRY